MTRIVYQIEPKEHEVSIRKVFDLLENMIPAWCHVLYIQYTAESSESALVVETNVPYLWCKIIVKPHWFLGDAEKRRHYAIHELLHCHLAPYMDTVELLLKELVTGPLTACVNRQVVRSMEASVQSLTHLVEQLAWTPDGTFIGDSVRR